MKVILDGAGFAGAVEKIAKEILEKNKNCGELALVGIHNKGVFVAQRIAAEISKSTGTNLPLGTLDITLYRDDLDEFGLDMPFIKDTVIPFDVGQKNIILIDDVLYTGRTVRAALDVIMDFGRPKSIQLAVLVDKGHRELPIEAGFVGVRHYSDGKIKVECKETDAADRVVVL